MTFPAQVPAKTGTWQSHYFQKIAELDTETARVAAALSVCDRSATPEDLTGEARRGYQQAQDDVRRAIDAVEQVRP